jgi:hypothetical protein
MNLYLAEAGLRVFGGHTGLIQPQGIELENQQHHGYSLLRGLPGKGVTASRPPQGVGKLDSGLISSEPVWG